MARQTWQGRRAAVGMAGAIWAAAWAGGCAVTPTPADEKVDFDPAHAHTIVHVDAPAHAAGGPGQPVGVAAAPVQQVMDTEEPTPPADARYTIWCQTYAGENHQAIARQVRDAMRAGTSLKKWYVVLGANESKLYYGFYRSYGREDANDLAEGERAKTDQETIRQIHNSQGVRPFGSSLPVPIAAPDPDANPAWDITRTGAKWSVEVAAFKDTPDRKVRAVEAVAEFRKAGKQAYYFHGDHASSVLIGAWARAAVTEVDVGAQNGNPDDTIIVTNAPMSPEAAARMGPGMRPVAPRATPVDPSLVATLAEFPDHATNGSTLYKRGPDGQPTGEALEHSYLVDVSKYQHVDDAATAADAGPAAPLPVDPHQMTGRGTAALPSLGDGK